MLTKYFTGSILFTAFAVVMGYLIGGFPVAFIVLLLGVLETSLSLDNAVVNATILEHWDEKWRRRFLTWGMLIAVFGMRLVFPIMIVSVATSIGPIEASKLALTSPEKYAEAITSVHHEVAAFGGMFLLMVGLKFFLNHEREEFWISWIERPLAAIGTTGIYGNILISSLILGATSIGVDELLRTEYQIAGLFGIVTYVAVKGLCALLAGGEGSDKIIAQGWAGFLYIEILDASFSFDGVIGAFALSNHIFVIALGLGIGAMFVRSFTIVLVEKGTLKQYQYLEPAAFYAIGALCAIMLIGVNTHIPEVITGLLSAAIIAAGVVHSIIENRKTA